MEAKLDPDGHPERSVSDVEPVADEAPRPESGSEAGEGASVPATGRFDTVRVRAFAGSVRAFLLGLVATPRRLALVFVGGVGLALLLGILLGSWWRKPPAMPLEELGLGMTEDATPPVGGESATDPAAAPAEGGEAAPAEVVDPEQQAFAERRQREIDAPAGSPDEEDAAREVPDFTAPVLVDQLAGTWELELGSGRRNRRTVRLGNRPQRTLHRDHFDVTLYEVDGDGLPPYYTVLELPERRNLLAFLDRSGSFRLVLSDLRLEPDGSLSWSGPDGTRRTGQRLDGATERREEPQRPEPRVDLRPPPRDEVDPEVLYEQVEEHLDELCTALSRRQERRVYALWDGRPDPLTRRTVEELLERYRTLKVWARLVDVEVRDGEAHFEAVVTIQGTPRTARGRSDVELREMRWRGRLRDGVQLDPFGD